MVEAIWSEIKLLFNAVMGHHFSLRIFVEYFSQNASEYRPLVFLTRPFSWHFGVFFLILSIVRAAVILHGLCRWTLRPPAVLY